MKWFLVIEEKPETKRMLPSAFFWNMIDILSVNLYSFQETVPKGDMFRKMLSIRGRSRERCSVNPSDFSDISMMSTLVKEFTAAARIMQSTSNELGTLVSGKV